MEGTAARQRIRYHAAFAGPALYQRKRRSRWLSDDALTRDTIAHMLAYVGADTPGDQVQAAALQVRALAGSSTPADLARATHQWMREQVRYVEDEELARGLTDHPEETEVLIRPADLLAMRDPQGDCDDFAMSTAALLSALQIPCSLKTAKCNEFDRSQWSHVYVVAHLAGGPLVIDTSHGPTPGWEVSPIFQSRLWPVTVPTMKLATITRPSGLRSGDYGGEYGPADTVGSVAVDSSEDGGGGIDWGSIIGTTEAAATKILGARYGVAQLNPGQYIRNADGSIMYQGTPGQSIPGLTSAAGSSSLLLLGVGAVVVVMLVASMSSKGK